MLFYAEELNGTNLDGLWAGRSSTATTYGVQLIWADTGHEGLSVPRAERMRLWLWQDFGFLEGWTGRETSGPCLLSKANRRRGEGEELTQRAPIGAIDLDRAVHKQYRQDDATSGMGFGRRQCLEPAPYGVEGTEKESWTAGSNSLLKPQHQPCAISCYI
jgi:hypothetical protein